VKIISKWKIAGPTIALLGCLLAGCARNADGLWTPPANPNPQLILHGAEQDAQNGHYKNALAKQIWFYENALGIDEALYGVRLSFALSSWVTLGKSYPPALEKLKLIRNEADKKIRGGNASENLFTDFEAINQYLGDDTRTMETFVWLDSNNPPFAKSVFDDAERSLIAAKNYSLCSKYLDSEESYQKILRSYQMTKTISEDAKFGERTRQYGEKSFSHKIATLVALLTVNNRKDEAARVTSSALSEWHDPQFATLLENAKKGEIPAPWP
jgi:hypothetical protein